ncbi:MAG: hypothetical protein ACI8P3_002044 [Saprospiraceae bacterium]|jgi:hypothetical protein
MFSYENNVRLKAADNNRISFLQQITSNVMF